MGFSAAVGGGDLGSFAGKKKATRRNREERAENKRSPADMSTSKKCSECIGGRRASVPELECFQDRAGNAMMMLINESRALRARPATLLSSSMAEHSAVNRRVVGSSPT